MGLVGSLDITTRVGLFAIYTVFSAEIASHVTCGHSRTLSSTPSHQSCRRQVRFTLPPSNPTESIPDQTDSQNTQDDQKTSVSSQSPSKSTAEARNSLLREEFQALRQMIGIPFVLEDHHVTQAYTPVTNSENGWSRRSLW